MTSVDLITAAAASPRPPTGNRRRDRGHQCDGRRVTPAQRVVRAWPCHRRSPGGESSPQRGGASSRSPAWPRASRCRRRRQRRCRESTGDGRAPTSTSPTAFPCCSRSRKELRALSAGPRVEPMPLTSDAGLGQGVFPVDAISVPATPGADLGTSGVRGARGSVQRHQHVTARCAEHHGRIRGSAAFGTITTAGDPRLIQLALKFVF
jgi:hypothetical protein